MVKPRAVNLVGGADLQCLEPVKDIQLGQRHAGDAGHSVCLAHHHRIEPATATLAPGHGAEFTATLTHAVAIRAEILGRERAGADAGGIGLGDPQHKADACRAGTGPGRGLAGNGVRGCNKRICAMVDVQHHALRAFEQHAAVVGTGLFQHPPALAGKGQDLVTDGQKPVKHRLRVCLRLAGGTKPDIVMRRHRLELAAKRLFTGKVTKPNSAACHLVLIGRANAAAGGADLAGTAHRLTRMIDSLVKRQDQRGGVGDNKAVRADLGPLAAKLGNFLDQMHRVDDNAVADDRQLAGAHNAGRQKRQLVFHPADDKRMAGIMATLKTDNDVGAARQPVHNLALAFIAPLGADYGHVCHAGSWLFLWEMTRQCANRTAMRKRRQ